MSSFTPDKPAVHHAPLKVADDTWLIQQMQEAAIGPLFVYLNSLVIKGPEPIIVDTGTPANREQWLKDVFSIDFRVEPNDRLHLIEFEVGPGLPCFDFRAYCRSEWGMSLAAAMAETAAARF